MIQFFFQNLLIFSTIVAGVQAIDCNQIQPSQIHDGNQIYLWGNASGMQIVPANFNCIFKIPAPLDSTVGYYAYVELDNGMRGINDYITVIDTTGARSTLNNRSLVWNEFYVIPGREMSIQIVTKSVLMNSRARISVEYHKARFGPTKQMETGSNMNVVDLSTLRGSDWYVRKFASSVTYVGSEQIHVTACTMHDPQNIFKNYFIIDGSIDDQIKVYTVDDLTFYKSFVTTKNTVTVISFQDPFADMGIVLNPLSEASRFNKITSLSSAYDYMDEYKLEMGTDERQAVEVVDFESHNITLKTFSIQSYHCKAYIVDGAPNNSSKLIMDLSNSGTRFTPVALNTTRFSLIAEPCSLTFTVESF